MAKKTIGITTSSEGHGSIAEAISECLTDYEIVWYRDKVPMVYTVLFYQLFPWSFKIPFKLTQNKLSLKAIRRFFMRRYKKPTSKFLKVHHFDAMINTYFGFNALLENYSAEHQIPFLNVITDPLTIHPMVVAPNATANLIFNPDAMHRCQSFPDNAHANYPVTGWFVRDRFQPVKDKAEVRKSLGLDPNLLTFLLTSGSEGTSYILQVLPGLLISKTPVQVIVACGNNKPMYRAIKTLISWFSKTHPYNKGICLRYVKNMEVYMQASDLVVGKAGPNTLFESVATHTPFFATTHIVGQEDGNLDLIKKYKLGFVEERISKALPLLQRIIANPKMLTKLQPSVVAMAEYNRQAKPKLLKLLKESL